MRVGLADMRCKALKQQTLIGAMESRLEFTAANLTTAHENVTSSESVIRDADMAKEMTGYTRTTCSCRLPSPC